MTLPEMLTTLAAWIGLGLAVYNAYRDKKYHSVKVAITPLISVKTNDGTLLSCPETSLNSIPKNDIPLFKENGIIALRVTNLSPFPVYVNSCGFAFDGKLKSRHSPIRYLVFATGRREGKDFRANGSIVMPFKLDSREAVTLRVMDLIGKERLRNLIKWEFFFAYVETSDRYVSSCRCEKLMRFFVD